MAFNCFGVFFNIAILAIISQRANCLISCYTCTSHVSWEDCDSKAIKKDCSTSYCTTSKLDCSVGQVFRMQFCYVNYTIFFKSCGDEGREFCRSVDQQPSCPAHMFPADISHLCCHEDYCNSGPLSKISGLVTGMSLSVLALLVFLPFKSV